MAVARSLACRPGRRMYSGKLGGNASPDPSAPARPCAVREQVWGGGRAVADALPHIQADPAAILTPAGAYITSGPAGALDALTIVLALWRSQSPLTRHRRRDDPDPETLHAAGGRTSSAFLMR